MERLKQLTEKLNRLTHDGAFREEILEVTFDIIRELMVVEKPVHTENQIQEKKAVEPVKQGATVQSVNERLSPSVPDLSGRLQQLRQESVRSDDGHQ